MLQEDASDFKSINKSWFCKKIKSDKFLPKVYFCFHEAVAESVLNVNIGRFGEIFRLLRRNHNQISTDLISI